MANKKNLVYVVTSGIETPERLYAPFILATTAKSMDFDATIYFVVRGVTAVKKGAAEKIKLGSFPSLKDVMEQAIKAGVKLLVCDQSTQVLGIDRGDYIDGVKIVGAATLNDIAVNADGLLTF